MKKFTPGSSLRHTSVWAMGMGTHAGEFSSTTITSRIASIRDDFNITRSNSSAVFFFFDIHTHTHTHTHGNSKFQTFDFFVIDISEARPLTKLKKSTENNNKESIMVTEHVRIYWTFSR